ncbi:hypothetical protein [Neorickettsia helminthoeca]|uniref:hypothetical protein n=1 Tax=Neorickettsia helminthoeca TaxID=33994 RepID=UPI000ACE0C21|nr:hypothetical protein [Neorickettsia helminthoeca]
MYKKFSPDDEFMGVLKNAILPSASRKVGGSFLDPHYHPKLLELYELSVNVDKVINDLCLTYRGSTKVSNLKLGKKNLIGYYVEVPKSAGILDSQILSTVSLF